MDRKKFLTLSGALALAASVGAQVAPPTPRPLRKKGLCLVAKKDGKWLPIVQRLKPRWMYSWGAERPELLPKEVDFTPMIWGYWGQDAQIAEAAVKAKALGIGTLLGFNEPDQHDQSNLSVERVLDVWPVLMRTGLRLGSPGCVHPDRDWMKAFMKGVEERKLRVDFICMHSYGGPDPDGLVGRVRSVSRMFGNRPVWITEYAVGDWNAKSPDQNRYKPAQVADFMRKVFPKLDELECLERHAWFPSAPSSAPLGTSALTKADGSLTELGQLYASL